jgi:uncharacterized membrane protein
VLATTYNDWTIISLSPLAAEWRIAGAVALALAAGLVLWSYRGARRRWPLSVLRLVAALLVLGFLFEPAVQLRVVRKIRNRLAIVVDRSASMQLNAADGRSRYHHVLARLGRDHTGLDALSESHVVELFDLDGPLAEGALSHAPEGERTDLVTALENAKSAGGGRPLAGIVLLSDGADNVKLEGSEPGTLAAPARDRLLRLGAPVNVAWAADADSFRDLAIADVRADEFAFVHNTIEIDVTLESTGIGSFAVPVTLRREGAVVAAQEVVTRAGQRVTVRFETKPDQIGSFVYSVSVPPTSGEAITANNERSFVLQVIRDKIRVLQVAGRPSWDERFLRQHLKENPNVDLISFFILRSPTDDPSAPENDLSLIPFPVDELFTDELASFDVVIFQNFDYRPYQMARYLPNIRDAVVDNGLGFVMIGGDQSFGGGAYSGTAIEEIVPVTMNGGHVVTQQVVFELTEAGRRHPITDLSRGTGSNERLWQRLPSWTSINCTGGPVPTSAVLVTASDSSCPGGSRAPLVVVMDTGEGRSMAIATESMWRWRFALHRDGGAAERAYHRFWSNALHWLVRDPEHSRIRVLPAKRRFDLGEEAPVSLTVRGLDYQPVAFAQLRVTLERAGGGVLRVDDVMTGEAGTTRMRYEDLEGGAYRVSAEANAGGEDLGRGTAVFLVEERSLELSRGAPRPDLLAAIAHTTRGAARDLDAGLWDNLEVVDPDVVEVDRRRNIELWDNGWALAIGVLLLALDWSLRRRSGYL